MPSRRRDCLSILLISAVFLAATALSGCQGVSPTAPAPTQPAATAVPVTPSRTPVPATLPPTWTPTPPPEVKAKAETPLPSTTATPDLRSTLLAATQTVKATTCQLTTASTLVAVEKSWEPGWCTLQPIKSNGYEYALVFPGQWAVNTFGAPYPSLSFFTRVTGIDLRLYQVFSYSTKTRAYTAPLEQAPEQATTCNLSGDCLPVMGAGETISRREIITLSSQRVLVVDSRDRTTNIRRYFFLVPFTTRQSPGNRLFYIKLITPAPLTAVSAADAPAGEQALLANIETMLTSVRQFALATVTPTYNPKKPPTFTPGPTATPRITATMLPTMQIVVP